MSPEFSSTNTSKWRNLALFALGLTGVGLLVILFVRYRRLKTEERARPTTPVQPTTPLTLNGLTEAEAEARFEQGQDNAIRRYPRRSRRQIIRENTLTIFNLNLVGLVFVQSLLGRLWDVLATVGVLVANVGAAVFQEEFAGYQLRALQQRARPQATVIREGKARNIDSSQIVLGDVLACGSGDQIMADGVVVGKGQMEVDESLFSGNSSPLPKRPGDPVYAGSICIGGRAAYRVEKVGDDRFIAKHLQGAGAGGEEFTPIERIMDKIMRYLLVIMMLLAALLLMRYYRFEAVAFADEYIDAFSVIFNLAPAGLFFMVVLTYVAATADLGRIGALVHRSRSVESLAQVDVIAFAKAGILTGTEVEIEPIAAAEDAPPFSEARIRQILGDYARSISLNNLTIQTMAAAFPGTRRMAREEAAFMSLYGWSARLGGAS